MGWFVETVGGIAMLCSGFGGWKAANFLFAVAVAARAH